MTDLYDEMKILTVEDLNKVEIINQTIKVENLNGLLQDFLKDLNNDPTLRQMVYNVVLRLFYHIQKKTCELTTSEYMEEFGVTRGTARYFFQKMTELQLIEVKTKRARKNIYGIRIESDEDKERWKKTIKHLEDKFEFIKQGGKFYGVKFIKKTQELYEEPNQTTKTQNEASDDG